ncbi:uncharacterized protein [Atheta coriaria]|uniref:uncharacterized protein n=1 Tax=Dalotia coriaria TaxID=877792 RepID=UPI0031F43536
MYCHIFTMILFTLSNAHVQILNWSEMNHREFETLLKEQFTEMSKTLITEINLRRNRINRIDWDAFNGFVNLTHLYLSNNMLKYWNVNLPVLQLLDISNNNFVTFKDIDLEAMPALHTLQLNNNQLENINWNLTLGNITEIDLRNNVNLTKVQISSESLQVLSLKNTSIQKIDLKVPKLRELNLCLTSFNKLEILNNICNSSVRLENLSIMYTAEDKSNKRFECPIQVMVLVGCQYSTLRKGFDDVAVSAKDYFKVKCSLYGMLIVSILLSICFVIITTLYLRTKTERSKTEIYYVTYNKKRLKITIKK